jgi:ABC-2 type transport system permease protein
MTKNTSIKKKQQRGALFRMLLLVAVLVCVNILASFFHYGLDLTAEKRFTLVAPTKKILHNLHDVVEVDVYLKGKFPAYMQRLQEAVHERLQAFKEIAGDKLVYRFSDPLEGKSDDEKKEIAKALDQKGISIMYLKEKNDEEMVEKPFLPWALVRYSGREMPVLLVESHQGFNEAENVNLSESRLEYKLAYAINTLGRPDLPHIAYLTGNGEQLNAYVEDALRTIAKRYRLDSLNLLKGINIPIAYDAVIIDKPTLPFTEQEQLKIDQYVMRGGHVLWLLDQLNAPMDSLVHGPQLIATDYGLNLDKILFNYGVRINPDLIEDMQCASLPYVVGMVGDKPDVNLRPWVYFPIADPASDHPIVRNMEGVLCQFASDIDTIATPDVKKTMLLQSSKYSRTANAPVRVSLTMMNYQLHEEMFRKPYRPIAVLLEGKFRSVYRNRLTPSFLQILSDSLQQPFKAACDSSTSMIVVADGDVINNDYTTKVGAGEMGYWRYTGDYYANKDFMLNCLEYLTDRSSILQARSKLAHLRLLDSGRVKDEKGQWQFVNVAIPIILVLVFASAYFFFRKRRYEKQSAK